METGRRYLERRGSFGLNWYKLAKEKKDKDKDKKKDFLDMSGAADGDVIHRPQNTKDSNDYVRMT